MKYQGIVFDFNGVLLWDTVQQEEAWRYFSEMKRGSAFNDEEMRDHVHGRPNVHTMSYLMNRKLNDEELKSYIDEKEAFYRRLCLALKDNFKLSPGAIPLLDYLKTCQVPRTIATASEITNLKFFIERFHLDQWFDIDQIIYDNGRIQGKPSPEIYLKAADSIGQRPEACIVVEDSVSGIKAADRAGMGLIVALGEKRKQKQLEQVPGVTVVIQSLYEFPRELIQPC